MTDSSGRPPAGWYADATRPGTERWWDGRAWTEHVRLPGAPPPPLAAPQRRAAAAGRTAAYAPPPVPAPAPDEPGSGSFGLATGLVVGVIATVSILVGGGAVLVARSLGAADDELVNAPTSTPALQTTSGVHTPAATGGSATLGYASEEGLDDVVSCDRTDPQTIVLEVVNSSPRTSSYVLTVGFFDDSGARLADEATFLNHLRPGERAIEEQITFEEQGTTCEVLEAERFAAATGEGELAEIGPCEVGTAPDALGSIQASVAATNATPETSDYAIAVAFVGADGVRRGSGTAVVESVRPGETAPTDVSTTLAFANGYSCDVVAVTRTGS